MLQTVIATRHNRPAKTVLPEDGIPVQRGDAKEVDLLQELLRIISESLTNGFARAWGALSETHRLIPGPYFSYPGFFMHV